MTCATIRTLVHEYLDGELPPQEQAAFTERLASCTECRELVALERAASARVRSLMRNSGTPHWLGARISAAIAAQSSDPRMSGRSPGTARH